MAVNDYSTTPASNGAIAGINIAEGCLPGNVNDAIRQMMADIKAFAGTVITEDGGEATGAFASTTLAATLGSVVSQASGAGNAHVWLRDATGENLAVLFADPAGNFVRLRKYTADGTASTEIIITADDVTLEKHAAGSPSSASLMTRARADARFSPLGHTHDALYIRRGAGIGDLGCLVFAKNESGTEKSFGQTISGSSLRPSDSSGIGQGSALSGTWMSRGRCAPNNAGSFEKVAN